MVSKAFLTIGCACGKHGSLRRDVDDDRQWEYNLSVMKCTHFDVRCDAYTYAVYNPFSSKSDTIIFELHGKCLQCNTDLSKARASRCSLNTGVDNGTLKCSTCSSTVAWVADFCANALLKTVGFTAVAALGGAALGAGVAALAPAAGIGAGSSSLVSGVVTVVKNAQENGDAGVFIAVAPALPKEKYNQEKTNDQVVSNSKVEPKQQQESAKPSTPPTAVTPSKPNNSNAALIDKVAKAIMSEASIGNEIERTCVGYACLRNHKHASNQTPTSDIINLATRIVNGQVPDPTKGANHWYSPMSMPKENTSTSGFDCKGGLEQVEGIDKKNYKPEWANKLEQVHIPGVREKYFKFYKAK